MTIWELVMCILMKAMMLAQHAMNRVAAPGMRNRQANNFGSCLIMIGATNAVVMISLLADLPKSIFERQYHLYAMFVLVVGVSFVSGLAGIMLGSFLLDNDNYNQYRILAMLILCACCVAAPCAIGIISVAYFSSFLMSCACYAKYSDKGHDEL